MSEISASHFATSAAIDASLSQGKVLGRNSGRRLPVVAIVGAAGQVGTALRNADTALDVELRALTRADLDVTDAAAVAATPALSDVDVIINTAAATDVDGAEANPGPAHRLNALAPKYLANRAAEEDAYLVHLSTDYVFGDNPAGGTAVGTRRPLRVDDPTAPQTVYGRTKLEGENNIRASGARAAILRTAWVWSGPTQPEVQDFVSTMIGLAGKSEDATGAPLRIKVVNDQHGSPTFAGDLADAIWRLVALAVADLNSAPVGTFHVTGSGEATWYQLAREVFALTGHDPDCVSPCTSSEFPRPARRPAWSVLDGAKWRETGLGALPEWQDTLRAILS